MSRRTAVLAIVAWLYLALIVVQVALAGASLFGDIEWTLHRDLGWGIGTAALFVLIAALAARLDHLTTGMAVALAILALAQPELAAARDTAPFVAALHPLNALVLASLAWTIAWRATREALRERLDAAAPKRPAADRTLDLPGHVPSPGGRGSLEDGTSHRV